MNQGEKNEILFKVYLCYLKKNNNHKSPFGEIKKLGFGDIEYKILDNDIDFNTLNDEGVLKKTSKELGIEKSSPRNKADVHINGMGYSIKYMNAAAPSIINHTNRKGFLRIANQLKINISDLDEIVNKYWDLRISNQITEDCGNNNPLSPFKDNKEILRSYLEYFCFTGTGSSDSKNPADNLIKFNKFDDPSSWKIYSKENTVDEIWDGLYFCMRDISKSGVKNYENSLDKDILENWTRYSSEKYRGALSVRYKSK